MPLRDLQMMLEAANVLEARERMARIVDGQVAAGIAKKRAAREHISSLRRQASRSAVVSSSGSVINDLSAMGLNVKRVTVDG